MQMQLLIVLSYQWLLKDAMPTVNEVLLSRQKLMVKNEGQRAAPFLYTEKNMDA